MAVLPGRDARVVEITTPKKWTLNGLWLGPAKPKRVYLFVHGLAGSMFGTAETRMTTALISKSESVLLFNNRGHDIVSKLYADAPHTRRGYKRIVAGAAHEVFADCVDDIEGAVQFAERTGVKEIVLIGHSTGCQKSIYWACKKGRAHPKVKGIVLLAPVSDRAAYIKEAGKRRVANAERAAQAMVKQGRKYELLPTSVWPSLVDAQRFVSLAAADSPEEIFLYAQPKRMPATLRKVKQPILALWAGDEEYADRPALEVQDWFAQHLKLGDQFAIIPRVAHSFKGGEQQVAKLTRSFISALV